MKAVRNPGTTSGFRSLSWLAAYLLLASRGVGAIEVSGITEAYLDATVSTPVSGVIGKHFCKEGDTVTEGQPIVDLDHHLEELEVARKQALLENATTVYERTKELAAKTRSVTQEELDKHRAEQELDAGWLC